MIPDEVLDALIKLGTATQFEGDQFRLRLRGYDRVNRLHWSEWDRITCRLDIPQLVALVKGLTLAERERHWIGGSVAGAIWVFRELMQREQPDVVEQLADWVFQHRSNPYLPFGSTRYCSYVDYVWKNSPEYLAAEERRREAAEALKLAQHEAAIARSAERMEGHRRLAATKAAERQETIHLLGAMPVRERWLQIANRNGVNMDYYPDEWASESVETLQSLPEEVKRVLLRRLQQRCKRVWRPLRNRIAQVL